MVQKRKNVEVAANMSVTDLLELLIKPFKAVFFFHKKKLLFFVFMLILFFLFLFPYSDLTSFSQDTINKEIKSSGSRVNYSKINFNLSPFGVQTNDFEYLSPALKKPLKIKSITLRPQILSLLKLKPGGSLVLDDLFGGEADLSFGLNGKTQEKTNKFNFSAHLEGLSLAKVLSFLELPYKISGAAFGNLNAEGEDSFRIQPEGKFKFNFEKITIPNEIPLPFGTLELPKKILWKNSNLFGKFEKGRLSITEGTLGTKEAPVNGRFKGFLNCSILKSGARMSPQCTDYNIKVELELDANFQKNVAESLSAFLGERQVNKIKLPQGGAKYLFSVQGNAARRSSPPRFLRLSNFD